MASLLRNLTRRTLRSLALPGGSRLEGEGGWWPVGSALAFEFDNQRGFNSIDRTKTTPDSILTYTNPSTKMVYGSDGVLRYAPHNLLLQSQDFTTTWLANATITPDSSVAPDGTLTADLLTPTANDQQANQMVSGLPQINGVTYTLSVWMRAEIAHTASIAMFEGAFAGGFTVLDVNVTTEWQRFSLTTTWAVTGTSIRSFLYPKRYATGNPNLGVYMWGAQLSRGSSALTYIPTTTAAVYSLPIDHNPTTFAPLGVLIEEQRTNLLTYSEQFNNAAWTKSSSTVTANAATAPDGTTTADKLIPGAASGDGRASQSFTGAIGTTYTLTVYGKQAEFSNCRLYSDDGGSNTVSVSYNLSTGAVSTAVAVGGGNWTAASSTITSVGNGWYRMSLTWTATAVAPTRAIYWCRDTGDGTSGIYLWGAQLEAGAFPTSYIPTVASQVTRLADQVSILTSAFAFNAAAGTLAVDAGQSQSGGGIAALTGTNQSDILFASGPTALPAVQFFGTQSAGGFINLSNRTTATAKMAVGFDGSGAASSISGGTPATSAVAVDLLSRINALRVGSRNTDNSATPRANGTIKRLTYFPTRRTNADLQVLTT